MKIYRILYAKRVKAKVMLFKLKNAPATLKRSMNELFADLS